MYKSDFRNLVEVPILVAYVKVKIISLDSVIKF